MSKALIAIPSKAFIFSVLLLSVLWGTACGSSPSEVTEPRAQIVQVTARDSSVNDDYTIFVDCHVRNEGASGPVVVTAEIKRSKSTPKRETVSISGDQTRVVSFSFPEAVLFETRLAEYQFNCRIKS